MASLKRHEERDGNDIYMFYDGPPTANGQAAYRMCSLALSGYDSKIPHDEGDMRVPRKAGWDTHGLPVELEVSAGPGWERSD